MPNYKIHKYKGFTLVEFIVTILLVGIVSAVAMSRILGSNTFNGAIIRNQLISTIRIAQQSALGRPSVTVIVQPAGNAVTISAAENGGAIETVTSDISDVSLSGDINITDSCATTNGNDAITNATPMAITFNELGNLGISGVTGNTGAVTSGLRICINNDPAMSVCVAPSGFAYAGDCDA